MSIALSVKNIDVFYDAIHALRRVSLHVNRGEIMALIGGNGAGKTTLLLAISGLIKTTSGEILYGDETISDMTPDKIVKMGVSHVPEGRLVFGDMTVEDNLELGAFHRYSSVNKASAREDMEKMFSMFPILKERRKQRAGTLSGGEQQMLSIGRALMARPSILCSMSQAWVWRRLSSRKYSTTS